jgi:hypothetical protein
MIPLRGTRCESEIRLKCLLLHLGLSKCWLRYRPPYRFRALDTFTAPLQRNRSSCKSFLTVITLSKEKLIICRLSVPDVLDPRLPANLRKLLI